MQSVTSASILFPDFIIQTILDLDPRQLHTAGITHIVFDLDYTLIPTKNSVVEKEYVDHLITLKQDGFTLLLGSNATRNIGAVLDLLDIPAVTAERLKRKPFSVFYRRVIRLAGVSPHYIVMVGDHVLNDIVGGNRAGMTTILVSGLHGKLWTLLHKPYLWVLKVLTFRR